MCASHPYAELEQILGEIPVRAFLHPHLLEAGETIITQLRGLCGSSLTQALTTAATQRFHYERCVRSAWLSPVLHDGAREPFPALPPPEYPTQRYTPALFHTSSCIVFMAIGNLSHLPHCESARRFCSIAEHPIRKNSASRRSFYRYTNRLTTRNHTLPAHLLPSSSTGKAPLTGRLLIGYTLLLRTYVLLFRQRMCRHPYH